MFLWEVLLLSGERASMCRGGNHGRVINPLAARCLATAETQTPLGTHIQRGETGKVGVKRESQKAAVFTVRGNPLT